MTNEPTPTPIPAISQEVFDLTKASPLGLPQAAGTFATMLRMLDSITDAETEFLDNWWKAQLDALGASPEDRVLVALLALAEHSRYLEEGLMAGEQVSG